ncbi:UNVERIFIED_CONTAM: hypothetical protein GTU68_061143, partial [Idotea baltica]|nr:hypothetical protein [Idotea baltica]
MSIVDDEVRKIERRIRAGELRPGDRLPSIRSFAQKQGLAPNTAATVYQVLARRGLVKGHGRRGTFVAEIPPVYRPVDQPVPAGVVDLSSGNPDPEFLFDLDGPLAAVSRKRVLYGEVEMLPELEAWMRQWFVADGIPADHIGVVSGALDGVERVLAANLKAGDRVAVEDPGYPWVFNLCQAMGFEVVPVSIDSEGMVADHLTGAIKRGIEGIVLTPRAQNPTGSAVTQHRARELSAVLVSAPEVLVIEDDHAAEAAGCPHFPVVGHNMARWAVLRSTAKSFGPDLRVAGLVGDEATVARVKGRQALGPGWVSGILQQLVVEMVSAPDVDERLARAVTTYDQRRQACADVLREAGIPVAGMTGFNLWVPVIDEASVVA